MKYLVLVSALVLHGVIAVPLSAQENAASTTIEQESPNIAKRGQPDILEPIQTFGPEFPKWLKQEDLFKADEPYPTELIGKFVKPISRAKSPLRSEITLSDDIEDISVLGKRDGVKGVEDAQNGKLIQKRGFLEGLTGKTGILTSITGLLLALGGIWIVTWLMKKREEEEERQKEEEWIRLKSTWKPVKWKPVKPLKEEKPPERREAMVRAWQEFKDSEFE